MAVVKINLSCELTEAVKVQYIRGNLFSQDNQANVINVAVFEGGEPTELAGTVTANVIRPDGGTVAVTGGTFEGNVATITMPSAVYAIPGMISVAVKITLDSVVTTIAAFAATVYATSTDTAVDPGTIIPSIQTLIAEIEAAVDSIPADYSSLWATLAPNYSNLTFPVAVGQYCTYDGGFYRCNTAIATQEAWTAAHWTATNIGADLAETRLDVANLEDDVSELKSAFEYISNFVVAPELIVQGVWENGTIHAENRRICYFERFFVRTGDILYCKPGGLYLAINVFATKSATTAIESLGWTGGNSEFKYQFLHDGYVCLNIANATSYSASTAITPSDYTMEISVLMQDPLLNEKTEAIKTAVKNPIKALLNPEGITANYNLLLGVPLINGVYNDSTGAYDSTRTDYIAYPSELDIDLIGDFVFLYTGNTTLTVHFIFLDKDHVRISNENKDCTAKTPVNVSIPNNCKYVLICASYSYHTDISPTNYSFSVYTEYNTETTDELLNGYATYNALVFFNNWTNNIYYFGEGVRSTATNRIGLGNMFVPSGNLKVWCDSGYSFTVGKFSTAVEAVENELGTTGWVNTAYLEQNHYYLINFRKTNDESISPTSEGINEHIHFCYKDQETLSENYVVNACYARNNVFLKDIGSIEGYQSFCKYNNKYYCSDGTNIYVYSNDFVLEQTASLSVGHANSMQLGNYHANYAYISGWEDDTVYIVNLDTLNIVGTISLPVSGYTTCAVDDVNEIVYIYHTTALNTVVYYNFIAYDYANNQILKNKKITRKFGAMQSCDFIDGTIIALNGLGTSAIPNGYMIYNTSGDVIGEYVLGSFASNEPEGVFVDRETKEVYMLFIDKHVYKVQSYPSSI